MCVKDCFHMTAKCLFWILIWNAHFELRSVHTREVIAIFELRSVHTSDLNLRFCVRERGEEAGSVWVFAVLFTFPVLLYVLNMCSARYYRRKWLEGHTSSAPPNHDLEVRAFIQWFARCVAGKHLWTVIWNAHFKLRIAMWFGVHTVQSTVFRIFIQNAHFELKFKTRTLPSCENSLSCMYCMLQCNW